MGHHKSSLPNRGGCLLAPTATVLRKIGGKQWELSCSRAGGHRTPKNPDPTKLKYVKPPSWQTLHRILGRDPKHG